GSLCALAGCGWLLPPEGHADPAAPAAPDDAAALAFAGTTVGVGMDRALVVSRAGERLDAAAASASVDVALVDVGEVTQRGDAVAAVTPGPEDGLAVAAAAAGGALVRISAIAAGRSALDVSAGPLRWRLPVDVVSEDEVNLIELVDASTHLPVGREFSLRVGE